jgi:hypothetical protein
MQWQPAGDRFIEEVVRARAQYQDPEIIISTMRFWYRYADYLDLVLQRYDAVDTEYVGVFSRFNGLVKLRSGQSVTGDLKAAYDGFVAVSLRLHLEIESFYVFAKILLDRVADTICDYFAMPRIAKGSSHTGLAWRFKEFCRKAGVDGASLEALISDLRARIVDVRTEMIEHHRGAGVSFATIWGPETKSRLIASRLFQPVPAGNEKRWEDLKPLYAMQRQTEDLGKLYGLIDSYIVAVLAFMEAHVRHSVLNQAKGGKT